MRIILLTGHRKSGTTLLHKLFDGHPELNVYPVDVSLLYAYLPCQIAKLEEQARCDRIETVIRKSTQSIQGKKISPACNSFDCERLLEHLWKITSPIQLCEPQTILANLAKAWCSYAQLDPDLAFLVKETSQSIYAPQLHNAGLDMQVIQIIRDPRDNYAAIKAGVAKYYADMGEGDKESLASVINRARMDLLVANQLVSTAAPWFTTVRFEDLVRSPSTSMRQLAEFCNVQFDNVLEQPTLLGEPYGGNSHEGKHFSGVSNANVGRWTERISDFETGVIEFWMGDVMKIWGYPMTIDRMVAVDAFSDFYNWYNCRYFYYDSFAKPV